MSEWTKVIKEKKGVIEIVRPILSDSERVRRENEAREAIKDAGTTEDGERENGSVYRQ